MKTIINFDTKKKHRILELKSYLGDFHRNIDNLNCDEKILSDATLSKINSKEITSTDGLNILIDKYLD